MMRSLFVALLLVHVAACDMISDATRVNVKLPPRDFALDTSTFNLPQGQLPPVSCTQPADCHTSDLCPQGACTVACNTTIQECEAHVPATVKNDYDLSKDAPEYAQFASVGVVSVGVDAVYFNITQNSLTVDTPELSVYAGPTTINSPTDAGAELVGTIPRVPSKSTGRVNVVFSATGQDTIKKLMDNFKTPFRVIVAGDVVVTGGDATPTGKLVGQVNVEGHVSL